MAAVAISSVLMTLYVLFNNYVYDDVSNCYAPMAREFARGNYERAFFHNLPPLMPVLAGLVSKLGFHSFTACMIVSGLSFIASLWPLRRLMLNFMPSIQASYACLLFATAPRILRYSGAGLLMAVKLLFVIWSLVLIIDYAKEKRTSQLVWLGINLAGLSLIRGEGILYVPFFFTWAMILLFRSEKTKNTRKLIFSQQNIFHAIRATVVVGTIFFIAISPRLYQLQQQTGIPSLDSRQSSMIKGIIEKTKTLPQKHSPNVPTAPKLKQKNQKETPLSAKNLKKSLGRFTTGSHPLYLILAITGLITLFRARKLSVYHYLISSLVLFNLVVFVPIAISSRYYTINIILFIPFVIATLSVLYEKSQKSHKYKKIFTWIIAVAVITQVTIGSKLIWSTRYDRSDVKAVGLWIDKNRDKFIKENVVPLTYTTHYTPATNLIIAANKGQYVFWANADYIYLENKPGDLSQVDIVITDTKFKTLQALFSKLQENIELNAPESIYIRKK